MLSKTKKLKKSRLSENVVINHILKIVVNEAEELKCYYYHEKM